MLFLEKFCTRFVKETVVNSKLKDRHFDDHREIKSFVIFYHLWMCLFPSIVVLKLSSSEFLILVCVGRSGETRERTC